MSHQPWLAQGEDDLRAAKILGAANHHSQAIWFAEQAVEKALKSILFAIGLNYLDQDLKNLGHDLSRICNLIPDALQDPKDPSIANALSSLSKRAQTSRYPSIDQTHQEGQVVPPLAVLTASAADLANADLLVAWCRERVVRALAGVGAMAPPPPPH